MAKNPYAIYDDAYIYFRYAQNLVQGCGFRFNCADSPVEGFTSPIYLLMLAIAGLLTPDFETISQVYGLLLSVAGLTLTLAVVFSARWNLGLPVQIVICVSAAILFGGDGYLMVNAVTGMEVHLAWLMAAAIAIAALVEHHLGLRVICVLALLVRPEFAIFLPLLLIFEEARRPRYWTGIAAGLALMTLVRWLLFGDFLPNTILVKAGGSTQHFFLGLDYIIRFIRAFPLIALAPLALVHRPTRRPVAYLLTGAALWICSFVRTGGDFYPFGRLAVPLVPLLTVFALVGIALLNEQRATPETGRKKHWITGATLAFVVSGSLLYFGTAQNRGQKGFAAERVERWASIGEYLRAEFPNRTVATVPIGAIAYRSGLEVIDMIGLTNQEIGRRGARISEGYRSIGHETYNTDYLLTRRPELIVMMYSDKAPWADTSTLITGIPAELDLALRLQNGAHGYRIFTPRVGDEYLFIFVRKDLAATLDAKLLYDPGAMLIDYRTPADPFSALRPFLKPLGLEPMLDRSLR